MVMKAEKSAEMLVPLGTRLVVKRLAAAEETEGGIIIPDQAQTDKPECMVLRVGPEVKSLSVGDVVLLDTYSPKNVEFDGHVYSIIEEDEVMLRLRRPDELDG